MWGGGKLNASAILLESLTAEECVELMAEHGGVEPETRDRILAAADGNPLFVEEMVALVRENGDIRVPGTVQALLQARLTSSAATSARSSITERLKARFSTAVPWLSSPEWQMSNHTSLDSCVRS